MTEQPSVRFVTLPLTKRQRAVYEFVAEEIRTKGCAPTHEEICARFGLSSLATSHKHLTTLQEKGYIRRRWNHSRAIELLWRSECCPTCGQPKSTAPRPEVEP